MEIETDSGTAEMKLRLIFLQKADLPLITTALKCRRGDGVYREQPSISVNVQTRLSLNAVIGLSKKAKSSCDVDFHRESRFVHENTLKGPWSTQRQCCLCVRRRARFCNIRYPRFTVASPEMLDPATNLDLWEDVMRHQLHLLALRFYV